MEGRGATWRPPLIAFTNSDFTDWSRMAVSKDGLIAKAGIFAKRTQIEKVGNG
jgi:hypothetical protein